MKAHDRRSDEELLLAAVSDDAAFSVFYRRYEQLVLAFFVRSAGRGELAADLSAEVFAELVVSLQRFHPNAGSASGWLFGIARNVLTRSRRRGQVEDRARRRLGLPLLVASDAAIERIESSFKVERVVGAQAGEGVGDGRRIPKGVKDAVDPPARDRGKEVLEVEAQHRALPGVQPRVSDDRSAANEALRSRVHGDVVEDLAQNPPLNLFEPSFGSLDDARQPTATRDRRIPVVAQLQRGHGALQAADRPAPPTDRR